MPLSESDARYLNQVIERRLRHHRGWRLVLYVLLGIGILSIGAGVWIFWTYSQSRGLWQQQQLERGGRAAKAGASSNTLSPQTQPVTYAVLKEMRDGILLEAAMDANIQQSLLAMLLVGVFQMLIGIGILGSTLARWNVHRRDAIFIALLREKCAVELRLTG